MTRRSLTFWAAGVIAWLILLIAIALYLSGFTNPDAPGYRIFKDLLTPLLALPTAVLATVLQRRISFLATLRTLYENAVKSTQSAIQYTHLEKPTPAEFAAIKKDLSVTIELFRGSFRNLQEGPDHRGLFPFEALKTINDWIDYVGIGADVTPERAREARRAIIDLWRNRIRAPLFNELDRQSPTTFDSPYWKVGATAREWPRPPKRERKPVAINTPVTDD